MSSPKLWAGRFSQETDAAVHDFNASLRIDSRLWPYDVRGSIAHVIMLGDCGIIGVDEADQIRQGLQDLAADLESGKATLPPDAEDVHMAVETLLTQRLGPVAGKLHTARSRNDQVATDIRLYVKDAAGSIAQRIIGVQEVLCSLADQHKDVILPGMTHLQHAQPVRLAHHLLAYFWMLARDEDRLHDAFLRADVLPLGSGALAGTTFAIDRRKVADLLGFSEISRNSLDAVSDRDFLLETTACLAILMMHLSRLCEELILWNSSEFGWIVMGDNVTTGSSIMPQKKNPDVAELVRGKTGRVYGNLTQLLTMMKGLPLAYNKDLQEDKESFFDTVDTAIACLDAVGLLLKNTTFRVERMAASMRGDYSTATDLADHLVRQGLPFRQAHEVVGNLVKTCEQRGGGLEDLTSADLLKASLLFTGAEIGALTDPAQSANTRRTPGGTGREAVEAQSDQAREHLSNARQRLERIHARPNKEPAGADA